MTVIDAPPLTTQEGHEIARAAREALDRVAALEEYVRTLAVALAATDIGRTLPTYPTPELPGPGELYVRDRLRLADRGEWGEEGIRKAIERQRERELEQRRQGDPAKARHDAEVQAFYAAVRQLGGTVERDGSIRWRADHRDPHNRERIAKAREIAAATMADTNGR